MKTFTNPSNKDGYIQLDEVLKSMKFYEVLYNLYTEGDEAWELGYAMLTNVDKANFDKRRNDGYWMTCQNLAKKLESMAFHELPLRIQDKKLFIRDIYGMNINEAPDWVEFPSNWVLEWKLQGKVVATGKSKDSRGRLSEWVLIEIKINSGKFAVYLREHHCLEREIVKGAVVNLSANWVAPSPNYGKFSLRYAMNNGSIQFEILGVL